MVESFLASSAFEDEVYRRAYTIHDELVLNFRRILQEKLFLNETIMLIGPEVPDIDENLFDALVVDASLDDFEDIEVIEPLNSLQGDDSHDVHEVDFSFLDLYAWIFCFFFTFGWMLY